MADCSVKEIVVYPIKSLDGVSVQECRITDGGSLENDRLLAIFDSDGNFVNAKRFANIHKIRAAYSSNFEKVSLSAPDKTAGTFKMADESRIATWLSDFFEMSLNVRRNDESGFPDDTAAYGPTFVSDATLATVCKWFSKLSESFGIPEAIKRFRPNVILAGADAFYEDQLHNGTNFFVGDITVVGSNPCARCVVPSRHPETGEVITGFSKILTDARKKYLPVTSNPDHFSHFYRLCLNTRIPSSEAGKVMRVNDEAKSEWDSWGKIF